MTGMEIRKVQMSGGSSYIVSLPKKWVIAAKIRKNDPVGLIAQPDGTLLVTPNTSGTQVQKGCTFDVEASTDPTFFLRELIGAYISGYTMITVRAEGRLPAFAIQLVRDFTVMAVGQEVVEETGTSIVIRDLLNPSEMPLENTLTRMSVIVVRMHEDAVSALLQKDEGLAENVVARDSDVDRLHWLISRQINLIYSDVNLSRRMGVAVHLAANYSMIAKTIERIGDHATRIAHNAILLKDAGVNDRVLSGIQKISAESLKIFREALHALEDGDIERANRTIEEANRLEERCRKVSSMVVGGAAPVAVPLVTISDSIRRVGDYSADICETVINQVIGGWV